MLVSRTVIHCASLARGLLAGSASAADGCRHSREPVTRASRSPARADHPRKPNIRSVLSEPAGSVLRVAEPEPDILIRARGLTKRFGDFTAVAGIDFELERGEVFGFLGPNGAGKSSTMRMIGCVSPPSGGELTIFGQDPVRHGPAIRARLGVVPQEDTLDVELTVKENLLVYGRYFGLRRDVIADRTEKLLDFVQLTERANDQVEPLSGGMKRRLTIARSLISEPEILLLDEPTTGLDPQARHVVWDRLYRLKQQGVTLVLTTHYMDEAEQLCDRLVVMDGGKIAANGSPRELIETYSTPEVLELRFALHEQEQAAEKMADVPAERTEVLADRILLYTADGEAALDAVRSRGLQPLTSYVRRSTLEDVFLRLTGRRLVDLWHRQWRSGSFSSG
jgi:lipooligosaccharide transport system ATP-binding protein